MDSVRPISFRLFFLSKPFIKNSNINYVFNQQLRECKGLSRSPFTMFSHLPPYLSTHFEWFCELKKSMRCDISFLSNPYVKCFSLRFNFRYRFFSCLANFRLRSNLKSCRYRQRYINVCVSIYIILKIHRSLTLLVFNVTYVLLAKCYPNGFILLIERKLSSDRLRAIQQISNSKHFIYAISFASGSANVFALLLRLRLRDCECKCVFFAAIKVMYAFQITVPLPLYFRINQMGNAFSLFSYGFFSLCRGSSPSQNTI